MALAALFLETCRSHRRLIGRGVLLAALGLTISACAINRVYEVKQQFCDFDENFSYSLGDQPQFTFNNPVVRASDVQTLVGYQPSEILADGDAVVHRYVVEKLTLDDSPADTFALNLRYQVRGGKARLQTVKLPAGMDRFGDRAELGDELAIAKAAEEICATDIKFALRPAEQDIDPRQLENLPSRSEVITLMGEPSWYSEEEDALIYEYYLQGAPKDEAAVRVVVWYDEAGIAPLRMETRYRDMRSLADFERGKVRFRYRG